MRLFLDDMRVPPDDGTDWVHARTVPEFLSIVAQRPTLELVSFDHDLGPDDSDGYDCARMMLWVHDTRPAKVWVHSANPVGAKRLMDLFADEGIPALRVKL
ncbi:MAG TPA: cyclic-phosphate processing receiver domain-containing protein [bacterium]|nr:cyclic-phosphate processing receiver domain-containing protein [bacterium]